MVDLPEVTPDYFEILAVRELRKVGLEVADVRVHRRAEHARPERGFVLEVVASLRGPGWRKRALVACRQQGSPVGPAVIESLKGRLRDAQAEVGIVFSTTDYEPAALDVALASGIALLRVVDGRTAFDASGWGPAGHYPAWLPAYLAQVLDRDLAGQVRQRTLEAGQPDLILHRLGTRAPLPGEGGSAGPAGEGSGTAT